MMRDTASRVFVAVTGTCLAGILIAATAASLVTAGIHIWQQLLTVMPRQAAANVVSSVIGFLFVLALIAGMFGYAHWKRQEDDSSVAEPVTDTTPDATK